MLALTSVAHLVSWLAIPRSGGVLNDLNVRLAPAELEFIVNDSGARALVVDDAFLELGRKLAVACEAVEHLIYAGADELPDGCLSFTELCEGAGGPPATVDPDAVAGIFYTGGTTGLPKGAMLTHRNLVANAKHVLILLHYEETDSYLHAAPMFHLADGASTLSLTWVGGKHVIIPAFDPALWLQAAQTERVTCALLVPTMINMVVNHPALEAYDLSGLRTILFGASPMPEQLLRAAMHAIPCDWGQAYGMTEVARVATFLTVADHRAGLTGNEASARRLRSAGRPIVGVEVEVRTADATVAQVGEPGEVWIRGANVMKGYWNCPQETDAALGMIIER